VTKVAPKRHITTVEELEVAHSVSLITRTRRALRVTIGYEPTSSRLIEGRKLSRTKGVPIEPSWIRSTTEEGIDLMIPQEMKLVDVVEPRRIGRGDTGLTRKRIGLVTGSGVLTGRRF
jgi:hypothetical protein